MKIYHSVMRGKLFRAVQWKSTNIAEVQELNPSLCADYLRNRGCPVGFYIVEIDERLQYMHAKYFESHFVPVEDDPKDSNGWLNIHTQRPTQEFPVTGQVEVWYPDFKTALSARFVQNNFLDVHGMSPETHGATHYRVVEGPSHE